MLKSRKLAVIRRYDDRLRGEHPQLYPSHSERRPYKIKGSQDIHQVTLHL